MAEWRIWVFNLDGDGNTTLVDGDLRASAQPTRELNGPGSVTLTVKPEQAVSLQPWRSLIVVELDGTIRGTGIISDMADDGQGALSVTCTGVLGYFDAFPADVNLSLANIDPAYVIHEMYTWAQGRTGSNLGIDTYSYRDSGIRIGNPDPPVTRPVNRTKPPRIQKIPPEPNKKNYKDYYLKGNKPAQVAARKKARDAYNAAMKAWRTKRDAIKKANREEESRAKKEASDYKKAMEEYTRAVEDAKLKIQWWDNPTVGQVVGDMAKFVDFKLTPRWNGRNPDHSLLIDRHIGARKTQLRFVVGENVIAPPPVDWDAESYATRIVFLGAGEGAAMIRGSAAVTRRTGLARTLFISDKSVRSKTAADKRAERALKWRQTMPSITELKIMDDSNARFGSFDVGDEIRVIDPSGRWAGKVDVWVRILSITESTDEPTATLTVVRSDKGE